MSKRERIGYGRPPKANQFRPGVSGNPSGRPKGAKSLRAELIAELGDVTSSQHNGHQVQITKARAIAKELVRVAMGGNLRAVTAILSCSGLELPDDQTIKTESPEDSALLEDFIEREVQRRLSALTKGKEMIPLRTDKDNE